MPDPLPAPLAVADRFLAAYAAGDAPAILALCAPEPVAEDVPWGDAGRNPITRAVEVRKRCPDAFDGFATPAPHLFIVALDDAGLIARARVWCDQAALYRRFGFPRGFTTECAA